MICLVPYKIDIAWGEGLSMPKSEHVHLMILKTHL